MKSLINNIYNGILHLINPKKDRIISQQVYANYIIILVGLFGLLSIFLNLIIGLEESVYISTGIFVLAIVYYFINIFSNKFNLITSTGFILIIICYNLYFIYNYGSDGPMVYFSFLILYLTLFYSNTTFKFILFLLFTSNIIVLYYLESQFSNFTDNYRNFDEQFFDHFYSIILVILGFVVLIRNLIKIQLNEKEISKESNQLKTTFLANTSHDLRAPANSILSFSQLLQEDLPIGELKKYINIIHSNSQQLLTLINDIFDISIIESKNLIISPQNININDVLEELYSNFKREIEVKEKDIKLDVIFGLPLTQSVVYIDPVRIKQILTNLLQNAIKHTKSGLIVFGYDKKMDTEELLFYVKDTGSGIPEDKIDDIFKRYVSNINKTKQIKGTGLGLHITASLVRLMNGKIWVESLVGLGSQFFVSIPIFKPKK